MPFPILPGEIDELAAKASRPISSEISTLFWRAANEEGITPERADALRLFGRVLGLDFNFHFLSLEQLTKDQAADLAALAPEIKNPEMRAIVADAAWARARGNPEIARLAVAAYLMSARNLEDPQRWVDGIARAERAIRLSRSLGEDDPSFQMAVQYLLELVEKYQGEDPLFLTGSAIELLREFGVGNLERYIEHAQRAADGARGRNNLHVARYYFDLLAKLHHDLRDEQGRNLALREFARTFEAEARSREAAGNNIAAAHFFTQAIQAHRRIPDSAAYIEALRQHLQRTERASISELKQIEGPSINIAEYALRARQHVAGQGLRDAILRLACIIPLADPDEMRNFARDMVKVAPLHLMFTPTMLKDSQGRTVGIAPTVSTDMAAGDEGIFAQVVQQMAWQRGFNVQAYIIPALEQVTLEHTVLLSELMGLCAYSPFVPPGHETIFAQGLHAGFQSDFMKAAHFLVPQIENSLRYLLERNGIVTTKLDRFGVQRHLDLSDLVIDPRLEEVMSRKVLLELRTLLTDNRGPNLRHQLAHGMLDDAAFASAEAVYAWWLILSLCLFSKAVTADPGDRMEPDTSTQAD